jgi:hypothetical protein
VPAPTPEPARVTAFITDTGHGVIGASSAAWSSATANTPGSRTAYAKPKPPGYATCPVTAPTRTRPGWKSYWPQQIWARAQPTTDEVLHQRADKLVADRHLPRQVDDHRHGACDAHRRWELCGSPDRCAGDFPAEVRSRGFSPDELMRNIPRPDTLRSGLGKE